MATSHAQVKDLESKKQLEVAMKDVTATFLHFWASWCEPSKHMDVVFEQLAIDNPHAQFFRVEAEEQPEITESYGIASVPYFLFFKDGVVVDTLEGANAPELANKVSKFAGPLPSSSETSIGRRSLGMSAAPVVIEAAQEAHHRVSNGNGKHSDEGQSPALSSSLKAEILSLINSQPVIVCIKGTVDELRCGFSRKVIDVLQEEGVKFGTFDILSNEYVRQGLKIFSDWPTFPQLYVKGELIGGVDIVLAMHETGELKRLFVDAESVSKGNGPEVKDEVEEETDLNRRLKALVESKPVLLFMKGTPEEPRCGFGKTVVAALIEIGVEYGTFNILSDDEVRQGLKEYSNWPTYPQLYLKGELLGGCDIILEMNKSGELKQTFADAGLLPKPSLDDRLKQLINSSDTILFMKGTPEEPRCGFSRKVVAALQEEGIDFGTFNILSDDEVRQGLKTFSNWPTFPQLYHKGELLGGCDIVMEMKANGELKSVLAE